MPFFEAFRLAIAQLRVQKLKSFFTLLGVVIGVTFLIAVVSIVEGMGKYVREDFFGRMLGANTFTLRARAFFSETTSHNASRAPKRANSLARLRPMSPHAPVMRTVFPFISRQRGEIARAGDSFS